MMNNKFWFLTKVSFFKKIKNKTFIVVNILLLILLLSLTNIKTIVSTFGGDFEEEKNIMVVDRTNKIYKELKEKISTYDSNTKISKISSVDKEKIKDNNDLIIEIENDKENIITCNLITYGYIDKVLYNNIENSINDVRKNLALDELNITKSELNKINKTVVINRKYVKKGKNKNEEDTQNLMNIIFPIVCLPFFTLTILVIQLIGAEINEEKSTRSMEIIISNVSPEVHFFSKILSVNLFAIMQSILIAIYSALGVLIGGKDSTISAIKTSKINLDFINSLIDVIPIIIIIFILTLVCYSLISGILSSVTTNMEDFQQMQTPIMMISLIGFYISLLSYMFDGSIFIRILSYIPFISAILSPCLYLSGVLTVKDLILSIMLMIVILYLLIKYGMKIYKDGILNYSSTSLFKKIIKSLKNN